MKTIPIRYAIRPSDPAAHRFAVRCSVAAPDPSGQQFALPAWIPGSYLIRDFARHIVKVRAEKVALTRTEYELLRQLALNADRVMTHADLLAKVWGPEYRDDVDYLRAYIRYLRRKLEADPANPKYILTTAGIGYTLACPAPETA